jgi:carbohydrate-selective porin OprB
MFVKADAQPGTAQCKAATATRRSTVDLKRFCDRTPAAVRLLSLIAVYLCFSPGDALAQSMPREQPTPSVEGPSHTYLSASPSSDAVSPLSLATQYALGNWGGLRTELGRLGVVPTLILISDPFGNLHGGKQTGAATYNLVGLDFRIDTGRLIGWKGGQFDIGGL